MPERNPVPFRYEPVCGDLLYDGFRTNFHTERYQDVKDTLQYLCFASDTVREVEGTVVFYDDDRPPELQGMRHPPSADADGEPFPDPHVTLWSDEN